MLSRVSLLTAVTVVSAVVAAMMLLDATKAAPLPTKKRRENEVVNSIGMKLVRIPAGRFLMGSPKDEEGRSYSEVQHEVEITKPFYLGVYEVTQKQFKTVMGFNPSFFSHHGVGKAGVRYVEGEPAGGMDKVSGKDTEDFPVENVSWHDAVEFCTKLSLRAEEKKSGRKYRLPTEAEWEYAARGGASSYRVFHFGNSLNSKQANFDGTHQNGGDRDGPDLTCTCKVGSYLPNAFGLFDMHGNVFEWCSDWSTEDYYSESPRSDPQGPQRPYEGACRVIRGGSWDCNSRLCRSAFRGNDWPHYQTPFLGFRVVLYASSK
jgi:formylglycine-generating enzyme required for sulfatase activity